MKIDANGTEIRVMGDVVNEDAYISLTDIAKYKNPDNAFIVVANWMRNHSNIRGFASAEELVVLINLEDTNADLIRQEVPKIERLKILREKAYRQLEILKKNQEAIVALQQNLIKNSEKSN